MLAHLAYAEGSPSTTLVIDARTFPDDELIIGNWLTILYQRLQNQHSMSVLKYALIRPSTHPMFDLDYRFVQCIPGSPPEFEFKGSCGHSILNAATVASHWGWLPLLAPDVRVRVYVENNGDHVVCQVDEAHRHQVLYTAHFIQAYNTKLRSLLLAGEPVTQLQTPSGVFGASLVSVGNPYVFVDAQALNITSSQQMFAAREDILQIMQLIRQAAIQHLGWNPRSVFPKIAIVGAFEPGQIAVRAISVPSWHPTIALTGAVCLSAAAAIKQSVVGRLLEQASAHQCLQLQTPNEQITVAGTTTGTHLDASILYISVPNKLARLLAPVWEESLFTPQLKEMAI
jgi:2-methylaconitate cis-trans-isomerase PrpF